MNIVHKKFHHSIRRKYTLNFRNYYIIITFEIKLLKK